MLSSTAAAAAAAAAQQQQPVKPLAAAASSSTLMQVDSPCHSPKLTPAVSLSNLKDEGGNNGGTSTDVEMRDESAGEETEKCDSVKDERADNLDDGQSQPVESGDASASSDVPSAASNYLPFPKQISDMERQIIEVRTQSVMFS